VTLIDWLAQIPPAIWLQRSAFAYLLVNAAHIASLGVFLGAMVALDLRILGWGPSVPFASVGPFLQRLAAWGLSFALLTGIWLFITQPAHYINNAAFITKVGLVIAGVLNAAWLHAGPSWKHAVRTGAPLSNGLRAHALVSLLIWFGAIVAGRWIGFL
jgi:hypothetical protein